VDGNRIRAISRDNQEQALGKRSRVSESTLATFRTTPLLVWPTQTDFELEVAGLPLRPPIGKNLARRRCDRTPTR